MQWGAAHSGEPLVASRRDRFCGSGTGDAMLDVCQWRCGKAPLALGPIGLGTVAGSGGCVVVVAVGRLLEGCAVCKVRR